MSDPVEIVEYDRGWAAFFASRRDAIAGVLGRLAQRIEHVGSTSVPGLAAKPIVDIDVVIACRDDLEPVIERLGALGYRHKGDLGIPGREAFKAPEGMPRHHLYVFAADNPELARHLAFRDYLLAHPEAARAYGELKRSLAERYRNDREAYTVAKTDFVERALAAARGRSAGATG